MKTKMSLKRYLQFVIKYKYSIYFRLFMLVVSALVSDVFFTTANLFNLVRQVTPVGIIGMGMLLVILTGGIDLYSRFNRCHGRRIVCLIYPNHTFTSCNNSIAGMWAAGRKFIRLSRYLFIKWLHS